MTTEVTPDLIERYRRFCNVSTLVVAALIACLAVVVGLGHLSLLNLAEWFALLGPLHLATIAALFFWLFRLKLPKGFTRDAAVIAAMSDERVALGHLKSYRNGFWTVVGLQVAWFVFAASGSSVILAALTLTASTITFMASYLWYEWH